jgi:hypothetical protein
MGAGASTQRDVGIRRMITSLATPQYRNFEPNGTQTYTVMASSYTHAGTTYAKGAVVPYDLATNTLYSDYPKMERDFNRRVLDPSN